MSRDQQFHDLCDQVRKLAEIVEGLERIVNADGQDPRSAQDVAAAVRAIALSNPTGDDSDGGSFGDAEDEGERREREQRERGTESTRNPITGY